MLFVSGCGAGVTVRPVPPADREMTIAVLPVQNLSEADAPLNQIRRLMLAELERRHFHVLPDAVLNKFMARHRMRFTGGVSREISEAFKKETGAGSVLVTGVEAYKRRSPPKIALFSRLVKVGPRPRILWMDSAAMAGDDSPGLLGTGLISSSRVLVDREVKKLSASLCAALAGKKTRHADVTMSGRFKPIDPFISPLLKSGRKYRVLVVPFFNISGVENAGQIMQLQFVNQFMRYPAHFEVIEPGLVRHEFLNDRIIQWDGISLFNAKLLFTLLNADLIVTGKVLDYQDGGGDPLVNIEVIALERKSRRVVWSSIGYAHGGDGVYFFDTGKVNTAHDIASEMARWVAKDMAEAR